ncbi:MAG: chloride channel protein [Lachnospiraceae bacterium]|nr:chloride channel protein [Lachnospiraceae bacterium]
MNAIKEFLVDIWDSVLMIFIAIIVGLVLGVTGAYFSIAITKVSQIRIANPWILFSLPVGAVIICFFYRITKGDDTGGTNRILLSAESGKKVPLRMAPLIFFSTIFSHLVGASVGREGAALQLGGSIGYFLGKVFHVKKDDLGSMVMTGMSAAFSALLGTPLTATVFAMELSSVGVMHYSSFLPCVISATTAAITSKTIGAPALSFGKINIPRYSYGLITKVLIIGVICGFIALLFCYSLEWSKEFFEKHIPNIYIRAFAGGSLLLGMTFVFGPQVYNGAGLNLIIDSINGNSPDLSFLLKILFTVVSITAGYRGGEIVPSFVVGATSGCLLGHLLGIDPGFAAALGIGAVFCGVTNCPISASIFCFELFGFKGAHYFLFVTALSFVYSRSKSLYSSQKVFEK